MNSKIPNSVLFVCLGNICRSPSAEAVFRKKSQEDGFEIEFDSAGTLDYHSGDRSDPRSISHAEKRGYVMDHLARQIQHEDFERFELIFVMDHKNLKDVLALAPSKYKSKIKLLTEMRLNLTHEIVPDPYYGSAVDFELVLNIVEDAYAGFRNSLLK